MMRNKLENGRTLDPRTLVVKEKRDLEPANIIARDLREVERQLRVYSEQIGAIAQQQSEALTEVVRNAASVIGGKDCRVQVEEETSIIERL
jgi:hypothetical protein